MSELLRGLGTTYGRGDHVFPTTFDDEGRLPQGSVARRAYAHWLVTMMGYLAGSARLLRDPYVVLALSTALADAEKARMLLPEERRGEPMRLIDHLLGLFGAHLAVLYGDYTTGHRVRAILDRAHQRTFEIERQPDWFAEAVGARHPFNTNQQRFKLPVAAAVTATVSRAHVLTGVLLDGEDGITYCEELNRTLGWVSRVTLNTPDLLGLELAGKEYGTVRLMSRELCVAAGVPDLLRGILETEVAPGVMIADFAEKFVGLMFPEDIEILGLQWTATDQQRLEEWGAAYTDRADRYRTQDSPVTEDDLTETDFFAVAIGR